MAVDNELGNVRRYLEEQGYSTTTLQDGWEDAAVIVVSGMKTDVFGDDNTKTEASIINAQGLTAEEVFKEVERAVQLTH